MPITPSGHYTHINYKFSPMAYNFPYSTLTSIIYDVNFFIPSQHSFEARIHYSYIMRLIYGGKFDLSIR